MQGLNDRLKYDLESGGIVSPRNGQDSIIASIEAFFTDLLEALVVCLDLVSLDSLLEPERHPSEIPDR